MTLQILPRLLVGVRSFVYSLRPIPADATRRFGSESAARIAPAVGAKCLAAKRSRARLVHAGLLALSLPLAASFEMMTV
jgi:hypothetical protein